MKHLKFVFIFFACVGCHFKLSAQNLSGDSLKTSSFLKLEYRDSLGVYFQSANSEREPEIFIFPLFSFSSFNSPNNSSFINSRGAGIQFKSGNLEIYSSFYDTQISNLNGKVSDSTLYGLNYVRFKGKGEAFQPGEADRADFDDANGYLKYRTEYGTLFYGKYLYKNGPSEKNNLLFNSSSGTFPYFSYTWQNKFLSYHFMYGFLKNFHKSQSLSDKTIIFHKLQLHITREISIYSYEAIMQISHSVKVEYMNPLLFLRSADHYNFSPDNALLGLGTEYSSDHFRTYIEILIDDMDIGKLGTGWFRNKTAGLVGTEFKQTFSDYSINTTLESNWVTPFTFSHRNSEINLTHYGTPIGPELGPNSLKIGLYNSLKSLIFPIELKLNYEFLAKGKSDLKTDYGDDINIGHPENLSSEVSTLNSSFSNYPKLLDGEKVFTNRYSVEMSYFWKAIQFQGKIDYYSNNFIVPHINIERGFYWSLGMKYKFNFFDNLRPEFW